MRLKFAYHNRPDSKSPPFKPDSTFEPPMLSCTLENYLYATKYEITESSPLLCRHNLSASQQSAISNLRNNKDIVIPKADKNNTTVILNKADYLKEALSQLNDGIHYVEIPNLDIKATHKLALNIVQRLKLDNKLDEHTFGYLYQPNIYLRTPLLYFLLKIHKIKHILANMASTTSKDPNLNIRVPGRPIISQCSGPTESLGRYLDYFLKPIVKTQLTYIRDTTDLIKLIENLPLPKDVKLVAYDITSLYTNLPFDDILEALRETLPHHEGIDNDIARPTNDQLLEITKLILTKNEFEFNDKFYKQIVGAPQGAVPSPEICDIAIYRHINSILDRFQHGDKILLHKRFRDDGLILFNGTTSEIESLFTLANSAHDLLKFTYDICDTEISFLDISIYKDQRFNDSNILDIKSYPKPTETFQYLARDSAHPTNCFHSLIHGETTRHMRNNSSLSTYKETVDRFSLKLKERGYSQSEINDNTKKVDFSDRNKHIYKTQSAEKTGPPLVFVTTFDPKWAHLKGVLSKH